jgi:large subunit ribosomal protein L21
MLSNSSGTMRCSGPGHPISAPGPALQPCFDSENCLLYNRRLFQIPEFAMYAVVKSGGKQYRVASGDKIRVESLVADVGAELVLADVLMVADGDKVSLGAPLLSGASVKAKVVGHGRGDKVHIFKMRRRKHYRKSQGHRQNYTEIEILGIQS